ncbi:MAG: hypothetical protein J6J43_05540 [Oscillospiraceae bacterium]|nr:hypothetical protein [Oscillospiraceae bacterium]
MIGAAFEVWFKIVLRSELFYITSHKGRHFFLPFCLHIRYNRTNHPPQEQTEKGPRRAPVFGKNRILTNAKKGGIVKEASLYWSCRPGQRFGGPKQTDPADEQDHINHILGV